MPRRRVQSGARWEREVGYCRAVRVGRQVFIGGTAPVKKGGGTFAPGDAYRQTKRCFEIIAEALTALDGSLADVVRTRTYVTDISRWKEYGKAHREAVGRAPPAATMVQVSRLIDEEMLVEVEVDAVLRRRVKRR
jgi:enamine deaminase RidA (YjgF/YER057c/UK114 family)